MSFDLGDILLIDAPIADHKKYHICLGQNEFIVTICLFLNSDNKFEGCITFNNEAFLMIPPSKTGKSVVSLALLPRYTEKQLAAYKAVKVGELSKDIAGEIALACATIKTLSRVDKAFVVDRLTLYAES